MAERDDPKLSVRPRSERKPTAVVATRDDQLADFVAMGSGRSIVDPAPVIHGKPVPISKAVSPDVAVVADLEAKLLDDLEALSSAFYSHSGADAFRKSEEPVMAASNSATAAPPAKPQPAAPSLAAAPPLPAAVLPPRDKPQAPAASPTSRTPVAPAKGTASEKP
jgi:hypothetical protein